MGFRLTSLVLQVDDHYFESEVVTLHPEDEKLWYELYLSR